MIAGHYRPLMGKRALREQRPGPLPAAGLLAVGGPVVEGRRD